MFQAPCPAAGSSCLGFHSYYRQEGSVTLNQHFAAVPRATYGSCPAQAKTQELKQQLQMSLKLGHILLVQGCSSFPWFEVDNRMRSWRRQSACPCLRNVAQTSALRVTLRISYGCILHSALNGCARCASSWFQPSAR